ncbi:MAG: carboxylating nicotinate-nucleotide diphosphorylase [Planctomycetota bacterium]
MTNADPEQPGPPTLRRFVSDAELDRLIAAAKAEDFGRVGDVTSAVMIDADRGGEAVIAAREAGVIAGGSMLWLIALAYDEGITVKLKVEDGQAVEPGGVVAKLTGPLRSLLAMERVALNFCCHLSGVATLTRRFVDAVAGTEANIYDTRKTLPGLRGLEKYAVACGGGHTHRLGLHDALLIKDNHVAGLELKAWPKAINAAIKAATQLNPKLTFSMVEVDSLDQLAVALKSSVDVVLLDNFKPESVREAVTMRDQSGRRIELEVSGGVTLDSVRELAEAGADRISVGALTHSAKSLDLGLDLRVD